MATEIVPAPVRAERTTRPVRTANHHLARMRQAEDAARSLSVRLSVRSVVDGFAGVASDDEIAAMKARRDSLYLLAAAHRSAVRRLERPQRIRARVERVLRPVVWIALRVRRAVTA